MESNIVLILLSLLCLTAISPIVKFTTFQNQPHGFKNACKFILYVISCLCFVVSEFHFKLLIPEHIFQVLFVFLHVHIKFRSRAQVIKNFPEIKKITELL